MNTSKLQCSVLAAILLLLSSSVQAGPSDDYGAAWEQLKKMAGTWDKYRVGREDHHSIISYHVTSGGSVLFEEFLGDTPDGVRAMATAYHMDGDDIVATHYCGAGNQPRMRAALYDPESKVLRFDFWDITDLPDPLDYYTTNIELYFEDDENVELRFRGKKGGVLKEWHVHRLHRLTSRPHEAESDEAS